MASPLALITLLAIAAPDAPPPESRPLFRVGAAAFIGSGMGAINVSRPEGVFAGALRLSIPIGDSFALLGTAGGVFSTSSDGLRTLNRAFVPVSAGFELTIDPAMDSTLILFGAGATWSLHTVTGGVEEGPLPVPGFYVEVGPRWGHRSPLTVAARFSAFHPGSDHADYTLGLAASYDVGLF
jgi:hypothetical protein